MPPPIDPSARDLDSTLRLRAVGLSLGLASVFSLLGWRLVNLHVGQAGVFREVSREVPPRDVPIPAMRGAIFDRGGEAMAVDRRSHAVVVDRNILRDFNLAQRTVSQALGIRPTELRRYFTDDQTRAESVARCLNLLAPEIALSLAGLRAVVGDDPRGEVVVKKDLDDAQAQSLQDFIDAHDLPGVFVREAQRRSYPYPDLAVHVVGFANSDNVGVAGVEKSMNKLLAGKPGRQWMDRDPRGGEVLSASRPLEPPTSGRSLRLTLDLQVQRAVEDELDAVGDDPAEVYVPPLRSRGVTVILMEPGTNAIIAMANRPHHRLDDLSTITPNRAVAETFEPGSTFKIGAYAGALDSQLVGLATPLNLHGGHYRQGAVKINDEHPIDGATVLTAFAKSSNIGAYKLAAQLGAARYYGYLRALGIGQRTGVDLPQEATGQLRPVAKWGALSLRSISFGYEVNVSPLQLLNAYAAVVNGGVRHAPRLIEAVLDESGAVVEEPKLDGGTRVCSSIAARNLRTGMLEVVKNGTAKKAAIPGFLVGGKTGTAQKYVPARKGYIEDAYVVSFVGFAESERGPELIGVVVIDDPEVPGGLEYGGQLAAPLFRRIASRVLATRGVAPNAAWMPNLATDH